MAMIIPFPLNPNSDREHYANAEIHRLAKEEARRAKAMISLAEQIQDMCDALLENLSELELNQQWIATSVRDRSGQDQR